MRSNTTRAIALAVSVGALVALFLVLGDDQEPTGSTASSPPATTGPDATGAKPKRPERPEVPEIVVAGGSVRGGPAELSYELGDRVRFVVRSDVAEEVHVHGYDIHADVAAGGKVTVGFEADLDGVYEVELEISATEIARLRIEP